MKMIRLLPLVVIAFFGCSPSESNDKAPTETARIQYPCMSANSFGESAVASGTGPKTAVISWNTCSASYSPTTSSYIEVVPLTNCGASSGTGPLTPILIPLPNIFSPCTGSYNLNVSAVQEKCMNWRLVNQGSNNQGQPCKSVSAWHYYNFSP